MLTVQRTNTELDNHIRNRKKIWKSSKDMIIVRTHTYLNDKQIEILNNSRINGRRLIEYNDGKHIKLFYAKRKHIMYTILPNGKKVKTIIFTGMILRHMHEL